MTVNETRAREMLDLALHKMRQGDVAAAIELYDSARASARSEELLELITIRKAEALIAAETDGPEVTLLPEIVMRRRSSHHVYLAAYALLRKYSDASDRRRALSYGELALTAATDLDDCRAQANVLNGLGIVLTQDSRFSAAIEALEQALVLCEEIPEKEEARMLRAFICANLGGARIINGQVEHGAMILEEIVPEMVDDYHRSEAFIDLSFAYMQLEEYDKAELYGRRGLQLAAVPRQVRNANHALAEIASRTGRVKEASAHYDVVASFYPDFKNVKELLLAVDVLSVVNWKA
jgi:tetratricopeptide (TPR) repeat protein